MSELVLPKHYLFMKRLLIASAMLIAIPILAQVKEGKIVYERTMQLQIRINDDNPAFQNMIPKKERISLNSFLPTEKVYGRVLRMMAKMMKQVLVIAVVE